MDRTLEDTFTFRFTTRAFATGIPGTLTGGVLAVMEDAVDTEITAGVSFTASSVAGLNLATIVATAANGYANGSEYDVYIKTGTVGGVSVVGEVVGHFSLGSSAAAVDLANGTDGLGVLKTGIDGIPTTAEFEARTIAAAAAANLELQYDTTGLTGDTFPATQSQVGNIGSSSGGSLSFQVEIDNAITDTIDNAAAVDKGSGLVGIPVTSHAFTTGFEVTIAGSINYNNAYTIVSETTNEIVITETYTAETFGGSETIISTIKTIVKIGTEAGTFANVEALDDTYHVLTNAGDNLDWVYQIDVGGGRTASLINFHGYLTGNNDTINIQAYDFVGSDWETRAVLQGTSQTTDQTLTIPLLSKHTGITGADIGKVLIRFVDATAAGHILGIDELLVEAVGIGQTVGYANGQIWVSTVGGVAGTEPFVNGTADNPVLTLADAKTLSTSVGIGDFHIINGSSITLAEGTVNESYFGDNWTLALGGQDVAGAYFQGAAVLGVGTSATEVHYEGCDVGTMSVQKGHFDFCSFDGTVTHTLAGDYNYHNCYSKVAGAGAPTFTKTAGQVVTVQFRNWSGSITVSGIQASDVMTISGTELGDVVLNGADGTVKVLGIYESLTDNRTGAPTLIEGAFEGSDVTDILVDVGEIGTAGAGLTDLGGMSAGMKSEVGDAAMDEALSGHQTQGTAGAALTMTAYAGSHGPGVYIDDGAANTGTTLGDDGTVENPVSTIAAATTIASSLGVQTFYLINDTEITLAQAYEGYTFAGLGLNNKITLGSQDVDNAGFHNVILTGTQGGMGLIYAIGCSLTALASAEIIAWLCWLTGNSTLRAATTHIFKDCCSAVAGQATPDLTFPGAGTTSVNFRRYSGGLTVKNATALDTMSFEADGQIIIDASCTSLTISVRGNCQITDNGTTTSITQEAAINLTNINAESDTALSDYDGPTNAEMEARTLVAASYFDPATDTVANVTTVATNTDMRGTDNAALAAVLGALADAAASGDPTSADTVMQYLKQLVNTLEGTVGIPIYPASADPANNVSLAEAIRAIRDDVTGLAGATMRGTDSAALASVATEARLAELDAANLPADIAALNDYDPTAQMVESYAANGVAPTRDQLMFAVHQMLMQFGIAGTSLTVRKLDDATTAFVVTLDDGTNPTDAKRV